MSEESEEEQIDEGQCFRQTSKKQKRANDPGDTTLQKLIQMQEELSRMVYYSPEKGGCLIQGYVSKNFKHALLQQLNLSRPQLNLRTL